jgi:hypothetical protein
MRFAADRLTADATVIGSEIDPAKQVAIENIFRPTARRGLQKRSARPDFSGRADYVATKRRR